MKTFTCEDFFCDGSTSQKVTDGQQSSGQPAVVQPVVDQNASIDELSDARSGVAGMLLSTGRLLLLVLSLVLGFVAAGCDQKERVVDIETPGVDVQVDRSRETGEVDIEIRNPD